MTLRKMPALGMISIEPKIFLKSIKLHESVEAQVLLERLDFLRR
jgi:hypothetical protein